MEPIEGSKLYSFEFTKASYLDVFSFDDNQMMIEYLNTRMLVTVTQGLMTIRIRFKEIIRSIQFCNA